MTTEFNLKSILLQTKNIKLLETNIKLSHKQIKISTKKNSHLIQKTYWINLI